ncbi:hypothetical protein [Mucilaginibacter ginkgonis]|uniref:Uncharacterized protein n=1 Tax=Mucilaginibacter ginkgonis TaxID=2682091 RepID=A0A7T7FAS3_9SPHI|nr:hypothetical protein [Mucilaginibacter ginkgonis]QQL49919.1 hypothetical protein GO620_000260 [Mucilaginibacter ginkgonis]
MRDLEQPFEISYQGSSANVIEAEIRGRRIFQVHFTDGRKPLSVIVGRDNYDKKFWTSIPEGRQQEAEEVGRLIAGYIRNKIK